MTSNVQRAAAPGNVLLRKGEANLRRKSVVNVSQLFTVDKAALVERIGRRLSTIASSQVLSGVRLLTEPRDVE